MRTSTTFLVVAALLAAAAYVSGVFGPAEHRQAATTPEACHAAAVEAARKPNPTNVPCDWKVVESLSPGGALNGRYEAVSEGQAGRLVIMEHADKPARLAFSTAGENPRYICTAALESRREADMLVARVSDVPGCDVTVKSGTQPGLVVVTATEACNVYCNMRGSLTGEFKLMAH
ncbi:MAG: hypothetical protein ACM3L9_11240 [Deltaproteobacteria bacterium]